MSDDPGAARPPDPGPLDPDEAVRLGRRRFFRAFVSDAVRTAANVVGVAGALQRTTAEMASAILTGDATGLLPGDDAALSTAADEAGANATRPSPTSPRGRPGLGPGEAVAGYRSPFRLEAEAIVLLDQRRLPDDLLEVACRNAPDVRVAISEGVIRGAPLLGQVTACAIALAAAGAANSRPFARRAIIHGSANSLRNVASSSGPVRASIDRMTAIVDRRRDLLLDGPGLAQLLRAEAEAIVGEATSDHAAMAAHGATLFAAVPTDDGVPLRVLTLGSVGALAGGQVGTVLGVVHRLIADGRAVEVVVCETRPSLAGTRLTAWELAQAGVGYELIADNGAGALMASGEVDIVLVGAEAIAANGDVLAEAGTCGLAVLAARHGLPFAVVAPGVTISLDTRDGSEFHAEPRSAHELLTFGGRRVAPVGAIARYPAFDLTPADLVGAIVTEEGVLARPFEAGLTRLGLAVRARGAAALVEPAPDPEPSPDAEPATDPGPVADGNPAVAEPATDAFGADPSVRQPARNPAGAAVAHEGPLEPPASMLSTANDGADVPAPASEGA